MNTAEPGTVSAGTLKTEDLLSAFADTLESLIQDNADHWCGRQNDRDEFNDLVWEARELDTDKCEAEEPDDIIGSLIAALGYFAPEGHVFGAHEGDGADFGFWPSDESPV